jgi:fumarylacetoacetase
MSTGTLPASTWAPGASGGPYDLDNLPYCVFSGGGAGRRVGARIGDHVVDLPSEARRTGAGFADLLDTDCLNPLMAAGSGMWSEVRGWLQELLADAAQAGKVSLAPLDAVDLHLPFEVADFVDFYASIDHATNVGRIFRPDGDALMPNWRHLPVGYHGRSGSVVVSGTGIRRPSGQRKAKTEAAPTFGPSRQLDIEAELGFVVGRTLPLGQRVATGQFRETVFGVCGLNDWSARDIQAWEYVPLGPNLGKSFATSIAAWVTPLAALDAARCPVPEQTPKVLPYLNEDPPTGYDIDLEVEINGEVVSRPPYSLMYWSPAQMLAHMTVNGASLRVGDLYGSGTISGPERDQRGSLLELSWGGAMPLSVAGQPRAFLEDGDEVVIRYTAPGQRGRIGLGEVRGKILPSFR